MGKETRDLIPLTIGGAVWKSAEGCVRRPTLASVLGFRRYHDKVQCSGLGDPTYLWSTLPVELASRAMAVAGLKLDCSRETLKRQAMKQRKGSNKVALAHPKMYDSVLQPHLK